ncbi:MAG: adenylyltransferase/cytidyltransferase family protein [Erysipelotrichaceae bacterium]|nr:adenylyltransferase/cytidyltransferase family protein [Erysipelotrichaceae bacterium]
MRVYRIGISRKHHFKPAAACIGYFDGIHTGHRKLINKAIELAEKNDLESCVITFEPDPSEIYGSRKNAGHLLTYEMKYEFLNELGVDRVYAIQFDENISIMTPEAFINYLNSLNIRELVCGFDFTFGHKGQGNADTLVNSGLRKFNVSVIDSVTFENRKISSRDIAETILEGNVKMAEILLGYPYRIRAVIQNEKVMIRQYVPADGKYKGTVDDRDCTIEIKDGLLSIEGIMLNGIYIGKDCKKHYLTVVFNEHVII